MKCQTKSLLLRNIYLSFILVQNMRIDTCRLRMYLSTTGILKAHSREQQQKNSEQILK